MPLMALWITSIVINIAMRLCGTLWDCLQLPGTPIPPFTWANVNHMGHHATLRDTKHADVSSTQLRTESPRVL